MRRDLYRCFSYYLLNLHKHQRNKGELSYQTMEVYSSSFLTWPGHGEGADDEDDGERAEEDEERDDNISSDVTLPPSFNISSLNASSIKETNGGKKANDVYRIWRATGCLEGATGSKETSRAMVAINCFEMVATAEQRALLSVV